MKQLSSSSTWFWKIALPLLWLGSALGLIYQVLTPAPVVIQPQNTWLQVIGICIFTPLAVWIALTMKYVSLDGKRLIVRNYWRTIEVPLKDVDRVWTGPFSATTLAGPFVFVELQTASPFGRKFGFIPPRQRTTEQHPVVQELLDLVDRANRGT